MDLVLFTVLCGVYAYTDARSENVDSINIGPVHVHEQIGELSPPYYPLTAQDSIATNNAIHIVEWSRTIFDNGFGPVPPLDPYRTAELPNVVIDFPGGIIGGNISLSNLELRGSKDFVRDQLTVRVATSRVDYAFRVPEYVADVDFDAHIIIDKSEFDLSGHMRLTATGVNVTGVSQAVIIEDTFQLEGIELDIIADDVKVGLQNTRRSERGILGIKDSNGITNIMVNVASKAIAQTALLRTNDLLQHFTIAQVMAILLPD